MKINFIICKAAIFLWGKRTYMGQANPNDFRNGFAKQPLKKNRCGYNWCVSKLEKKNEKKNYFLCGGVKVDRYLFIFLPQHYMLN